MPAHPNLRARVVRDLPPEARSRTGAVIARLGRKIAAYPILAIVVAFGAGYALMRWVRR